MRKINDIKQTLISLEEVIPPHAKSQLDKVKYFIFPNLKKPEECIYKRESMKVKQKCCGGTIKEVDGFRCEIKGEVTSRNCKACNDFKKEE